jgi:hypothetical protein
MFPPSLIPVRIQVPRSGWNLKLFCDQIKNRIIRLFIFGENSPGIPEIAHQYGNAEPVMVPAVLPHEGNLGLAQREQANQLSLVFGKGQ